MELSSLNIKKFLIFQEVPKLKLLKSQNFSDIYYFSFKKMNSS